MSSSQPIVAIIGGGIMGSAAAYFLMQDRNFNGTVLVFEPDPTYAYSATVRSAAAIRQQFNVPVNVQLSHFSYQFFKGINRILDLPRSDFDIQFTDRSYLVLALPSGVEKLQLISELQRSLGADVQFMLPDEIRQRFPWFKTEQVGAGCLGLSGEGWFDALTALKAIRTKAESLGAKYVRAEISTIHREANHITAVGTTKGNIFNADIVIDAAGAKAGLVSRMAGINLPIESRKRCAFVFQSSTRVETFTNLIDTTFANRGVYARPFGSNYMGMTSPDLDKDPESFDFDVDKCIFEEFVRPALSRRVEGFQDMQLVDSWAGHYEMNTFDQNAVLGPHPEINNFIFLCGFSGHGVMHAPAAARGIAEWIITGAYQTIDLSPLGYQRIIEQRPFDDPQASETR
jgi:FAD-dependent oxidoreductase domain-containing protein 1